MPVEPLHVRIMQAMAAQLETITAGTVIYNGGASRVDYWTTPLSVTRALLQIDQYKDSELPLLGIVRSSGTRVLRDNRDPGSYAHELALTIVGYVRGDLETDSDPVVAGDWLERLADDVRHCLDVDRTLGGLAFDSLPHPEGSLDTDDGAYEPRAAFEMPWLVRAFEVA